MFIEPTRVVVDDGGLGTTPAIAEKQYNIKPTIVFRRGDDWTLGAPDKFESIAYRMWSDSWTHFARANDTSWRPISEYTR